MIVVIAGMYRSGSTFTFNIAREILKTYGSVAVVTTESLMVGLEAANNSSNLLIKTHLPEQLITSLIAKKALLCICTTRKPEDAVASWMHIFGHDINTSVDFIKQWLQMYQNLPPSVLHLEYKTIDNHPLKAIFNIQRYLRGRIHFSEAFRLWIKYDKRRLKQKFDSMEKTDETTDIGFSYYDRETFMHRRHISSVKSRVAQDLLTEEQIHLVRTRLYPFVTSNGLMIKK